MSFSKENTVDLVCAPPLGIETLRERLVTRDGGGGGGTRGSLSKCASRYQTFLSKVLTADIRQDPSVADEIEDLKGALDREIKLYQIEMQKVALVAHAAQLQEEVCDTQKNELNQQLKLCQVEIISLRDQWTLEKAARRNQEEYEALAKLADKRPPRKKLQEDLLKVQQETKALDMEEEQIKDEFHTREKQFTLLLHCMQDLKSYLPESSEKASQPRIEQEEGEEVEEGLVEMDTTL